MVAVVRGVHLERVGSVGNDLIAEQQQVGTFIEQHRIVGVDRAVHGTDGASVVVNLAKVVIVIEKCRSDAHLVIQLFVRVGHEGDHDGRTGIPLLVEGGIFYDVDIFHHRARWNLSTGVKCIISRDHHLAAVFMQGFCHGGAFVASIATMGQLLHKLPIPVK